MGGSQSGYAEKGRQVPRQGVRQRDGAAEVGEQEALQSVVVERRVERGYEFGSVVIAS